MSTARPDVFERFANQAGLRIETKPILASPRDVLTPLSEVEQHHLVSLHGRVGHPLQLVFASSLSDSAPGIRDVLWWLAADAWTMERSGHSVDAWASNFGYPPRSDDVACLFAQHRDQTRALSGLLGDDFERLLSLYAVEAGLRSA